MTTEIGTKEIGIAIFLFDLSCRPFATAFPLLKLVRCFVYVIDTFFAQFIGDRIRSDICSQFELAANIFRQIIDIVRFDKCLGNNFDLLTVISGGFHFGTNRGPQRVTHFASIEHLFGWFCTFSESGFVCNLAIFHHDPTRNGRFESSLFKRQSVRDQLTTIVK